MDYNIRFSWYIHASNHVLYTLWGDKEMKAKIQSIFLWLIAVAMIVLNVAILYLMVDIKLNLQNNIDTSVNNKVKTLNVYDKIDKLVELKVSSIQLVPGKDGVDGANGVNGSNGKDGASIKGDAGLSAYDIAVKNGFEGTEEEWQLSLKGENGNDGLTPILRCNTNRNRWEQRYSEDDMWKILKDENNNPVPCTIKE